MDDAGSLLMHAEQPVPSTAPRRFETLGVPEGESRRLDLTTAQRQLVAMGTPPQRSMPLPAEASPRPAHAARGTDAAGLKADDIADYFLRLVDRDAGDAMTHLRLQKLVYYAQAWHLAITGEPLFQEDFEAWVHGPVVPSLYVMYRDFGWQPIPPPVTAPARLTVRQREILDEVWDTYSQFSARRLEEMAHSEDPWKDARRGYGPGDRCSEIIPKEAMRRYYRAQLAASG